MYYLFSKKDVKTKANTSEALTEIEKANSEMAREALATSFGCMKVQL